MKILVTGGTGRIGQALVDTLSQRNVSVRILTRNQDARVADGVEIAVGDLTEPDTVKAALAGVDRLFLLVGNVADELTQALLTIATAREAGVGHVTYLSVMHPERFPGVPHFIGKLTVEGALKASGLPYTILRPGYFYQNDLGFKDLLTGPGVYPSPIGSRGVAAVDVHDIAEAAAVTLTTDRHQGNTYDLAGPSVLTGPGVAEIWSAALGKQVNYVENTLADFEQQLRHMVPAWYAMDMRLMFQTYQAEGLTPGQGVAASLEQLIGHPPKSYDSFARATAAAWRS